MLKIPGPCLYLIKPQMAEASIAVILSADGVFGFGGQANALH